MYIMLTSRTNYRSCVHKKKKINDHMRSNRVKKGYTSCGFKLCTRIRFLFLFFSDTLMTILQRQYIRQ